MPPSNFSDELVLKALRPRGKYCLSTERHASAGHRGDIGLSLNLAVYSSNFIYHLGLQINPLIEVVIELIALATGSTGFKLT